MTFNFIDGTITTTSSEQTMFDVTADAQFATWIFLHNMGASETVRIKVSAKDQNAGSLRLYIDESISGVQANPAYFVPPVLTKQFKITVQRTAGSDIAVTWQRIEVT